MMFYEKYKKSDFQDDYTQEIKQKKNNRSSKINQVLNNLSIPSQNLDDMYDLTRSKAHLPF